MKDMARMLLTAKIGSVGLIAVIVVLIGTVILGASPNDDAPATTTCTPGSGLRAGSVPNGWDVDILAASQVAGVPAPILAAQLYAESSWNPRVTNNDSGAQGMAQFIPSTWAEFGEGDPYDPHAAIKAQGKYMGWLMDFVSSLALSTGQDQIVLALAAYNAGPGSVEDAMGIPNFDETKKYVVKIPQMAQETYAGDCSAEAVAAAAGPTGGVTVGPGEWTLPLTGPIMLTSPFGQRWGTLHAGLDLASTGESFGTVVAPTDLRITWSGPHPGASGNGDGYGWSVVGRTVDGTDLQMRFGHCAANSTAVSIGQTVAAGTALCTEGSTGKVRGPHLHFEIYAAGQPENSYASNGAKAVDPLPILRSKGLGI